MNRIIYRYSGKIMQSVYFKLHKILVQQVVKYSRETTGKGEGVTRAKEEQGLQK
jgi:hypothetical protein